jgi:holo-[acyl-carrier protein] synthase
MILGLGSDLCNIERIEQSITRFGDRFLNRIFTPNERSKAEQRPLLRTATYAKRFAAKEACAKALGTGIRHGVFWQSMEVVNLPTGQPTFFLSGGAAKRLAQMLPAGMMANIHLSLTDDMPWAHAIVIISAQPMIETVQ